MERKNKRIIVSKKTYDLIEEKVVDMYLELQLRIPISPREIAERYGYEVRYFSEDPDLIFGEHPELYRDGRVLEGVSYYDTNEKHFVIMVNDIDFYSEERYGFTIMHEIGHIKLGHKVDSELADVEANYFASYSLAPSPFISKCGCCSEEDIRVRFGVSKHCSELCFERYNNWSRYRRVNQYEKLLEEYWDKCLSNK